MLKKILKALKNGTFFEKTGMFFRNRLGEKSRQFIYNHYRRFPLNNNKIVFDNFSGNGYGDNPKYIAEEIHRRGLPWKMIWFVKNTDEPVPDYIRKVKLYSARSLYEMTTAKMWVDNVRWDHMIPKKEGQIYLQTWHGAFGCKMVEKADEKHLSKAYMELAKYDGSITDGIISENKLKTEFYKNYFWLNPKTEILEFGGPRIDILFNQAYIDATRSRIRKETGVGEKEYLILYAPTFRDDGSVEAYHLDFESIRAAFEKKTGKVCRIMMRLHPNVNKDSVCFSYGDCLIDGSTITDANDALICSDAVITDYSSILYEATLLKMPVLLYIPDYEQYTKQRNIDPMYFQLPYLKSKSIEELTEQIGTMCIDEYRNMTYLYMTDTLQVYDNGNAAGKAVDWLNKKRSNPLS